MTAYRRIRRAGAVLASGAGLAFLGACMAMTGAERPAASEFGLGPRASAGGAYVATLQPAGPLRVRRLQTATLTLRTAGGAPVEGAAVALDGGMPEHGHGLPTTPRVTAGAGGGAYRVEGLRFNMGGWWELRFRITSAAGTDSVTFNLDL